MLNFLQNILDKSKPHFEKGGRLERLYPIFEATDTILFSTDEVTESGPHIRDSIDTKRIMILVVISLLPLYLFGAINIGYQNAIAFMQDPRYKQLPQYLQTSGISSTFIAWKEALDKSRDAREFAEKLKEESANRENAAKVA